MSGSTPLGPTTLTVVASDTVNDLATNTVTVTVSSPIAVTSIVPSTTTPTLFQNVTVTANVAYYGTNTPSATATLNAIGLNSADSAVSLVLSNFNSATGLAVYTNTVTVSGSAVGGSKTLTVVASDTETPVDFATNSVVVTVLAGIAVQNGGNNTQAHFTTAVASETVTVTAGATALVVLFEDHGASPGNGEPSSVTWTVNGTTLHPHPGRRDRPFADHGPRRSDLLLV